MCIYLIFSGHMEFSQTLFILQLVKFRMTKVYAHFICIKFIFSGHMESLIKNSSSVSVKFEPEFLMSISYG